MALILGVQDVEIENNGIVITDTTGLYDAVDNPGGYETPNLFRTDIKLFLRSIHVDKNGTETQIITDTYDSLTVDTWTASTIKDGVKHHYIVGVDIRSNVPLDSDVQEFLDDSVLNDLTNESTVSIAGTDYTLYISKIDSFPIPQARLDRIEANEKVNKCVPCDEDREESQAFYDLLRMEMEASVHNFNVGNQTKAQLCIEKANEIGEQLYEES